MSDLTQQIKIMLDLQDAMNLKVNPDWRGQHFEWYRAIWVECAEMLDHYGWKWWKKQEVDLPQVQLELVDIFHFGLSLRLMENTNHFNLAEVLAQEIDTSGDATDFKLALETLASDALTNQAFNVAAFADCLRLTNMSTDDLFKQYVGKNTLNFFRQDHGYKDGSYIKVWDGREDNEYLVDILNQTPADADDFQKQVYAGLEASYPD